MKFFKYAQKTLEHNYNKREFHTVFKIAAISKIQLNQVTNWMAERDSSV
jgi:hypothetical protein